MDFSVEGRVTLHENRTLSIKEASFQDRGVYKCVASNAAGADSLAIRLHVAALPPVIHQEKAENISLPPGLSIHIHCTARAAPLPSVRWVLRDGTQIRQVATDNNVSLFTSLDTVSALLDVLEETTLTISTIDA